MSWISRIVNALRPARTAADLDVELQFHIEQRVDDLLRSGIARDEAERLARLQLGNPLRHREISQEVKTAVWLESLVRDLGFSFRALKKYRTSNLAAIASLGLAVGACTPSFVLIDALMFRPLPLPHPDEIISIARLLPAFLSPANLPTESASFSYAQYELLRDTGRDYAEIFAMSLRGGLQTVRFDDAGGVSENVRVESMSGRGFEILGVKPALGIGVGIIIGFGLAGYLSSQLFGVEPSDFWSLAIPIASILTFAILGAVPPALRAASGDPLIALRHE